MESNYSYKKDTWAGYHVQISNCGHQVCESEHAWGYGVREQHLFHYVKSGSGTLYLNGKKFHVPSGGLFFIPPNTRVKYVASKNDPWDYIWVGFSGIDAGSLMGKTTFSVDNPVGVVEKEADRKLIIFALQKIYENSGKNHDSTLAMFAGFFDFFSIVSRIFEKSKQGGASELVKKASRFISQNYQNDITVLEIAEFVGLSRSQLYRHFVAEFGISPLDFLTEMRIKKAKTLLLETDISIEDISNSVGFSNSIYFSRLFKKKEGVSPMGYRRNRVLLSENRLEVKSEK